ncbi:YgjV family protein [uncultured Acidaminococcus sp.]|uniref:YgjV family protein n=1 Tax=uncultured Acidaminococcus sp. TaxID=352152 RepID=UPI002598665E|nr:YgjV family protein [uncultured Acidaminococcus sp.]
MGENTILVQGVGFIGVILFLISYQVRSNRKLFILQTLGCLAFGGQFVMLGSYRGSISLLINIIRNIMLTKYKEYKVVRWKGWVVIFSILVVFAAIFTWSGWKSVLPVIGTIAGTIAYWTNNARKIRLANLFVNAPGMLFYDVLVKSWGGVLNESITIVAIVVSIVRFGWSALDGDKIES